MVLPVIRRIYHCASLIHPSLAAGVAKCFRLERRVVATHHGKFWIDPLSNFGQELIEHGDYEPEMALILERYLYTGAVFVDLGANEGYFSILASKRCGPAGRVYAIEPQARCQQVIQQNVQLNECTSVMILPVCVSDHAGQIVLHLHPATNTGATSIYKTARSSVRTSLVECLTLQAMLDANGIQIVDLLKIDIEGAEYEAVMGSPEVFKSGRVKAIALEYHPAILTSRGLRPSTLHEFLLENGHTLDTTFAKIVYVRS